MPSPRCSNFPACRLLLKEPLPIESSSLHLCYVVIDCAICERTGCYISLCLIVSAWSLKLLPLNASSLYRSYGSHRSLRSSTETRLAWMPENVLKGLFVCLFVCLFLACQALNFTVFEYGNTHFPTRVGLEEQYYILTLTRVIPVMWLISGNFIKIPFMDLAGQIHVLRFCFF